MSTTIPKTSITLLKALASEAPNVRWTEFRRRTGIIMDKAYAKCAELEGQVSGEHSIGHAKMVYLRESVGEDVFRLMGQIKAVFDPDCILNPGKVCDSSFAL